ncbi:MAG: hypothetical protein JNK49_18660 [Planctomycetes bacterium]|nr:hypothetical protein [Planctomycetota bacterium]
MSRLGTAPAGSVRVPWVALGAAPRRGVPLWLAAALLLVLCAPLAATTPFAHGAASVTTPAEPPAVASAARSSLALQPSGRPLPARTRAPVPPLRSCARATGARPSARAP